MTCCCKISETTWRLICFFTVCYLGVKEILTSMRTYSTDSLKLRLSHATDFRVIPFSSSPTRLLPTSKDQPEETVHWNPRNRFLLLFVFSQVVVFWWWWVTQSVAFPNAPSRESSVGCQQLLFENSTSSLRWPSTAAERQEIKQGFFEKGGFPGVIGCIDGTHLRIQGPSAHESDFVNRKGFHSINVQAICHHKDKYRI